jgi:hypothetical protein
MNQEYNVAPLTKHEKQYIQQKEELENELECIYCNLFAVGILVAYSMIIVCIATPLGGILEGNGDIATDLRVPFSIICGCLVAYLVWQFGLMAGTREIERTHKAHLDALGGRDIVEHHQKYHWAEHYRPTAKRLGLIEN